MTGFKDKSEKDITLALGEDHEVDFKLALGSATDTTEVRAAAATIDLTQAGATGNISQEQAATIPTIARSIFDVVQANPYFRGYTGGGQLSISVAGRNNRYNNIQIDGAVNNDIFGLSATGTPEGQTSSQPISFDSIQEYQLLVSPYDVRQGGFSGGGLNIITRSGSNELHGDGFFYDQNQSMVGKYFNPFLANPAGGNGVDSAAESAFSNKQGGGSLGGAIKKNKIFFFGTTDSQRESTPTGICVDCPGATFDNGNGKAAVDSILATLQTQYHYNPVGASGLDPEGMFSKLTNSDKEFVRVDFNLKPGEQLTIRNNFVNSVADTGSPSTGNFLLPDDYVRFHIKTDSAVGQLNSTVGKSSVNELRIASTEIRNSRGCEHVYRARSEVSFPFTKVTISSGETVTFGCDNSSTANHLDQDDIELNDDFTMIHGAHTFTFGTHDEFFHFQNLFIQNTFGNYSFTGCPGSTTNGIPCFQAGTAQSYSFFYSLTSNPHQQADYREAQYGAYVGDTWRASPRVTVTGGVRVDLPRFNHAPNANPITVTDFGLATNLVPTPTQFSPRVGMNWALDDKGDKQVRFGVGEFAGRTPYVWISDNYGNDGVDFGQTVVNASTNNLINYVVPPATQPITPTTAAGSVTPAVSKTTINLIDPNFKFPSQLRGNVAFDSKLPWGLIGTAELLWSKTLEDILYQNLNLVQTATASVDGRPIFSPAVAASQNLGSVILLTNSTQGHSYNLSYDVRRPFKNHLAFEASYSRMAR